MADTTLKKREGFDARKGPRIQSTIFRAPQVPAMLRPGYWRGRAAKPTRPIGAEPGADDSRVQDTEREGTGVSVQTILLIVTISTLLLTIGAYISPLGSIIFLGGGGGTSTGGGSTLTCDVSGDCATFTAANLEVDGITSGQTDPTQPVDLYNEQITVRDGATLNFDVGSDVVCPTTSFFNACVDNAAPFVPTCTADYAGCVDFLVAGLDVNGGTLDLLAGADLTTSTGSNVQVASGASLTFDAGASVVCPSTGFFNNCVDEAFTPTCSTNYDQCDSSDPLVVGVLEATEGVNVTAGTLEMGPGTTLAFDATSSVTCPTTSFLNNCVDEPFSPTCATNYDQCDSGDPLVVGTISLTEDLSIATGSSLTFAAGSSVTCPTTGFLNNCVDEAFTPTCSTNYDQCDGSDPLVVGVLEATEGISVNAGATLAFAAGATVSCPTTGFLNDCVDESGVSTPTCDEHATCTNFTAIGIDLNGGSLDLLAGAGLTTTSGTTLQVASGASLVFDAGSAVTCPTTTFFNDCVDEFYTPTCTEHTACTDFEVMGMDVQGGVVNLLAGADVLATAGSEVRFPNGASAVYESGALLQFDAGASVTCPSPSFLNACVDEFYTPTCTEHAACTNLATIGMNVNGGTLDLLAGASVTTTEGSTVSMANNTVQYFNDGAQLFFNSGSSVVCPTPGFLNDCVNEVGGGGGTFTPSCTEDYATCTNFTVQGIDVTAGTVDLTGSADLTLSSGSTIEMGAASAINMASNSDINVGSGADINVQSGGDIRVEGGATTQYLSGSSILHQTGSTEQYNPGSSVTYDLTSSIDFQLADGQVTCDNPIFDPSSGCTSGDLIAQCTVDYADCEIGNRFTTTDARIIGQLGLYDTFSQLYMSGSEFTMDSGSHQEVNSGAFIDVNNLGDVNVNSGGEITVNSLGTQTFASGSTLEFEAGAAVICPSIGFLNDCVDESSFSSTPTFACDTSFDQCNGADPFIAHTITPTAELEMNDGTVITMQNLSTLQFNFGSTVNCPTSGFLNDCVDEASSGFSPTCATDYDQCTSGDPFVVNTVDLVNDLLVDSAGSTIVVESSGELQVNTGGVVSVNDGGNVNVDSAGTVTFLAGGNLRMQAASGFNMNSNSNGQINSLARLNVNSGGRIDVESGGRLQVQDSGDILMTTGSTHIFNSGSTLTFNAGSVVSCPSAGFLNDCVDEAGTGGGSFTPTCATDYDQCNGADPFIVHTVAPTSAVNMATGTNINLQSGSDLEVESGADINVQSGGDIVMFGGSLQNFISGSDLNLATGATQTVASGAVLNVRGTFIADNNAVVDIGEELNPSSPATMAINDGSTFSVRSGGELITESGGSVTVNSGGGLTVASGGTQTLSGALTITGTGTVSNGNTITNTVGGSTIYAIGSTMQVNTGAIAHINSGGELRVNSAGFATVLSGGTLRVNSGGDLDVNSGGQATVLAGGALAVDSGGLVNVDGEVNINSGAVLDVENGGTQRVRSGGALNVQSGGTVSLETGSSLQASAATVVLGTGSDTTFELGASVNYEGLLGSVTCSQEVFGPSSGCTGGGRSIIYGLDDNLINANADTTPVTTTLAFTGDCRAFGFSAFCPVAGNTEITTLDFGRNYAITVVLYMPSMQLGEFRWINIRYTTYLTDSGTPTFDLAPTVCEFTATSSTPNSITAVCSATVYIPDTGSIRSPQVTLRPDPFAPIVVGDPQFYRAHMIVTEVA